MITTQEGNEEMREARAKQRRSENKGEERRKKRRNKRGRETLGESEKKMEKEDLMRSTGCYSDACHNKIQSGYTGQRVASQHPVSEGMTGRGRETSADTHTCVS